MKTLYLDCSMGAAGDMITASLLEHFEERDGMVERLNGLGIPHVEFSLEPGESHGIRASRMSVKVHGEEEGEHHHEHEHEHHHDHDHDHGHHHEHEHHHVHRSLPDIEDLIMALNASEKVKKNACGIYRIIAEAEGKVHGREPGEVHFHEVGTMDAVADVMAACILMDELDPELVMVSPLNTGCGTVKCAHGVLPVPAPATAEILKGMPSYNDGTEGELLTPTGAAIVKFFADEFGNMPVMKTESVGYGLGRKEFPKLNAVRSFLGETEDEEGTIVELTVNLDDMSPEKIGFAWGKLLELGAAEVFAVPVYMKKQRPGTMLTVLVTEDKKDEIVQALFRYTTTIGIRENVLRRFVLKREIRTVETRLGQVRKKISRGYGVKREKYEYEDIAELAKLNGLTIDEVLAMVEEDDNGN